MKAYKKEAPSLSPFPMKIPGWKKYATSVIDEAVNELSFFYDECISLPPNSPPLEKPEGARLVLLDGNLHETNDIQGYLESLHPSLNRESRVLVVVYSFYFFWVYRLMKFLRIRKAEIPKTFLTKNDLVTLSQLSRFTVTQYQTLLFFPFKLFFLGPFLNRFCRLIPGVNQLGLVSLVTLKPIRQTITPLPSLSVLVPVRNEAGNIPQLIPRLSGFGSIPVEIIFVEGHSTDDSWAQVQKEMKRYQGPFKLKAIQQTGKGKKNAVTEGFKIAEGELFTILDADLTMPPELLIRFYQAYCRGEADFINGSRLVYPLEEGSMQYLNQLGNIFFSKAVSFVTDCKISDSLCGTKLFSKKHYEMFLKWNHQFGEFDPFGDFELLFPAARLGVGIIDLPVAYRARTYGSTNIQRFHHGFELLKMVVIGFRKLKCGIRKQHTK